ncbi:hypothetical protein ACHAWF_015014 [Thalassiosira exigua]
MDPPTPIEAMTQSIEAAFPINYPIFEGDEISPGLSDDFDGNDSVGEQTRIDKSKKDIRLAERTSEILSSYRAFLHDHAMDETSSRGSDPPDDGFYELHYYEQKMKDKASKNRQDVVLDMNIPSSNHGGTTFIRGDSHGSGHSDDTACLLRDFSMSYVPLGSDTPEEKRKYKMHSSVLHSKRAKYGVFASLVVILAVVGVVVGTSSTRKKDMLTRLHSTIDTASLHIRGSVSAVVSKVNMSADKVESELEAKSMTVDGTSPSKNVKPSADNDALMSVVESEDSHIEVEAHEGGMESEREGYAEAILANTEDSAETKTEPEAEMVKTSTETNIGNASAASSSVATFDLGKNLHDRFKPLWLDWNGGSHDEAIQFCKRIGGRELCPYSAICPYGPGHNVMAGRRPVDFSSEGEQYAPVYGANRWTMVGQKNGDPSSTCQSHEQLEGRLPTWGLSLERPEIKQHIMCCTMPAHA